MAYFVVLIAATFFFMHLVFETLASFVKYNFSSHGRHMQGVSLSNIFAIISRGFVALYGALLALVVEGGYSDATGYAIIFSVMLIVGAVFSFFFSKLKILGNVFGDNGVRWRDVISRPRGFFGLNDVDSEVRIRGVSAIMLGAQFIAVVVAYGLCFIYPSNRLFIISLVPIVSMVGTLVQILLVEPRLASMVDRAGHTGCSASGEFLRARAISFLCCGVILLVMPQVLAVFLD